MPQRMAFESVRRAASTRRVAIRRHASATVAVSGMVRALDNLSLFTVRSPGGLEPPENQSLSSYFLLSSKHIYSSISPAQLRSIRKAIQTQQQTTRPKAELQSE